MGVGGGAEGSLMKFQEEYTRGQKEVGEMKYDSKNIIILYKYIYEHFQLIFQNYKQ